MYDCTVKPYYVKLIGMVFEKLMCKILKFNIIYNFNTILYVEGGSEDLTALPDGRVFISSGVRELSLKTKPLSHSFNLMLKRRTIYANSLLSVSWQLVNNFIIIRSFQVRKGKYS